MDTDEIVAAYGAAWNETDEAKRTALLEHSWADDGIYNDPTATAYGRAALITHIGGFHAAMPGHTIDLISGVDTYNGCIRVAWEMLKGRRSRLEGIDFGELARRGSQNRRFFGPSLRRLNCARG